MMVRRIGFAAVLAALLASSAMAQGDTGFARATVFVELEVRPPEIRGTMWIDRDAVEVKFPIDRDGDTDYTDAELYLTRGPLTEYVNQSFFLMWSGAVRPIVLNDLTYDVRPISRNKCVKLSFVVPSFAKDADLLIYSRIFAEISQRARTMVRIEREGSTEIWVLGPQEYFDARLKESDRPAPAGSAGRPAPSGPRFGCTKLCLGIDLTKPPAKCPRCGAAMARLFGSPVPGKGQIGRLGGTSMPFMPGQYRAEALLASPEEFRFYLNTESLEAAPIGRISGTVQVWTEDMLQTTSHKETLKVSKDGTYLWASLPKGMIMPIRARCMLELGDGRGTRMVDFFLPSVVEVSE